MGLFTLALNSFTHYHSCLPGQICRKPQCSAVLRSSQESFTHHSTGKDESMDPCVRQPGRSGGCSWAKLQAAELRREIEELQRRKHAEEA